jgi:hypothetical protein
MARGGQAGTPMVMLIPAEAPTHPPATMIAVRMIFFIQR